MAEGLFLAAEYDTLTFTKYFSFTSKVALIMVRKSHKHDTLRLFTLGTTTHTLRTRNTRTKTAFAKTHVIPSSPRQRSQEKKSLKYGGEYCRASTIRPTFPELPD